MLKRVGVLGFVLTIGAMLQPVAALAADRHNDVVVRDARPRVVEQYRAPVRHDDWNRRTEIRRDERVVVRTPANYYYAPAPSCDYRR